MNELPEVVTEQAFAWPARVRDLAIRSTEQYLEAVDYTKAVKGELETIASVLDPHIRRTHEAHKALVAEKARAQAPLLEAERLLKLALKTYETEQEAIRLVEEQRLLALARADEETRRVEAAAALEAEARATGDTSLLMEAGRVLDAPLPVSVSVAKTVPKVSGVSMRDHWTAKVVNERAFVAWVAAHLEHVNLVKPNQSALDSLARSMRDKLHVDGVQAVNTPVVSVGSR